jgi:hypothetical protein
MLALASLAMRHAGIRVADDLLRNTVGEVNGKSGWLQQPCCACGPEWSGIDARGRWDRSPPAPRPHLDVLQDGRVGSRTRAPLPPPHDLT